MHHDFISSTSRDLEAHRQAVRDAVSVRSRSSERLSYQPRAARVNTPRR